MPRQWELALYFKAWILEVTADYRPFDLPSAYNRQPSNPVKNAHKHLNLSSWLPIDSTQNSLHKSGGKEACILITKQLPYSNSQDTSLPPSPNPEEVFYNPFPHKQKRKKEAWQRLLTRKKETGVGWLFLKHNKEHN